MVLRSPSISISLSLAILLASCSDDEIRTYRVASDSTAETQDAPPAPAETPALQAATSETSVTWDAPDDWTEETPGQFQTAVYQLNETCRLAISMLPGDGGGIPANVNRWRGQLGMDPLPEERVAGHPLELADGTPGMLLFNLIPADPEPKTPGVLAAMLPLSSQTWYFKLSGPAADLQRQGSNFTNFLRQVRVTGATTSPAATAAPGPPVPPVDVDPPADWKPSEGSAMRAASFQATGSNGGTADISVVPLPGDSGSELDNVNRWRAQLHLGPLESADDPALGTIIEGEAGAFLLTPMTSSEPLLDGGQKASIIAAMLRRDNLTWFFKITGDAGTVAEHRPKFEAFVRSASFP